MPTTRSSLVALGAALGLTLVLEVALAVGGPAVTFMATMGRLFVFGATAALLANLDLEDRHGLQSRALLSSVIATLAAALVNVGGALATVIWSEPPLPVLLITAVLHALLPLMATTLLTVAVTPLRGGGIGIVAASSVFMFMGPAAAFAFLGGDGVPWLGPLARIGSTALALLGLWFGHFNSQAAGPAAGSRRSGPEWASDTAESRVRPGEESSEQRISISETNPRPARAAMALAPERLWHQALQGVMLLRAAELTRLVVMLLVFLLGFVIIPLGPTRLVALLLGQSLALVIVAVATLVGLRRFARIPTASGARGAAFAGLALAAVTVIHVCGAAAVDIAFVLGSPRFEFSLDHAARLSTLGTLVAVCLAIDIIARLADQQGLRQRVRGAALCYVAATLALTGADALGHDQQLAAVLLKLGALLLFAAGFSRLVRALTEVGPLMEAERRRALGGEFS